MTLSKIQISHAFRYLQLVVLRESRIRPSWVYDVKLTILMVVII